MSDRDSNQRAPAGFLAGLKKVLKRWWVAGPLALAMLWGLALAICSGCRAPADPLELNRPVNTHLANGRLVTVEVIQVNGTSAPGQAVEDAVKGFSKYVAGEAFNYPQLGITAEAGAARVTALRQSLSIGAGRNIAVADIEISGVSRSLAATSGRYCPPGTLQMPATRMFTTGEVGGFSRAFDSEVFIMENAARGLTAEFQGTILLYSERPVCGSCSGVIAQFQKAFPNVKVIVTSGTGI